MKISKRIFISRYVYSNSPLLQNASYELFAKSLIKFESKKVETFPDADWYFFYSRNGVYFGLRQLTDRTLLDNIKIATMGKGTALQYEQMQGAKPQFIGSGDADNVSSAFIKVAQGKKVVFIRAVNSIKSIQENLKYDLDTHELITYNNFINPRADIPETDIAIFTSPMNVDAYFKLKKVEAAKTLIALGKSTRNAISRYSDQDVHMPNEPSEAALRALIDRLESK